MKIGFRQCGHSLGSIDLITLLSRSGCIDLALGLVTEMNIRVRLLDAGFYQCLDVGSMESSATGYWIGRKRLHQRLRQKMSLSSGELGWVVWFLHMGVNELSGFILGAKELHDFLVMNLERLLAFSHECDATLGEPECVTEVVVDK